VLPRAKEITDRPHPATDTIAGLDHRHDGSARLQFTSGAQPGEARAGNQHVDSGQLTMRHD
jgi:hypothetical protein